MRVLLVSSGSGSRGGGELYLVGLAQGLKAAGCEVLTLVPDQSQMDELAEAVAHSSAVHRFSYKPTYSRRTRSLGAWLDFSGQARLARLFGSLSPDIVHINQQVSEDALDLVCGAANSGLHWLSTIHVGHSAAALGARFGTLRDYLTGIALKKVSGDHIAVSRASRDQLAQRFGTGSLRWHVVHNGVGSPDPATLAEARSHARTEWNVSEGEIVLGTVGRIEAQKDPLASLDLASYIARLGKRVRFVWIGDGSMRDALERRHAQYTEKFPLIIDGWRRDAAHRVAGLDIFLLPSRYEGLPLALLEAMHAGLPCVASRTDGSCEAIRDGDTGFLCGSVDEWRNCLRNLAFDMQLRARVGNSARAEAEMRFSLDAMARSTLEIYTAVRSKSQR